MPTPLINIGVNWPRDIPGMVNGHCPDRQWKGLFGGYSESKWVEYLQTLPRGATVIVDDEDPDTNMHKATAQSFHAAMLRRQELHRVLRLVRSDLQNADAFGPSPRSDAPANIWNDRALLRRWRAGNNLATAMILPHVTHLGVELYHDPRKAGPVNGTHGADFRKFRDGNVAECRRLADGRPVIGIVWLRTKGTGGTPWGLYVGDDIARAMLDELAPMVDAIAVWDCQFEPGGKALSATPYASTDPVLDRVRAFAGANT